MGTWGYLGVVSLAAFPLQGLCCGLGVGALGPRALLEEYELEGRKVVPKYWRLPLTQMVCPEEDVLTCLWEVWGVCGHLS